MPSFLVLPVSPQILPPSLDNLGTSLPQNELCLSLLHSACRCWALPVFVSLCLSVLGCGCLFYAVPIFLTLCFSLLGCACLCYAVRVRVGLCLSLLRCACPCWAVPVFVTLCLIEFSCDGPYVCLGWLETEYWPWFPFIPIYPSLGACNYPTFLSRRVTAFSQTDLFLVWIYREF